MMKCIIAVLALTLLATTAEAAQKYVLTFAVANGTQIMVTVTPGFTTQALCQAHGAAMRNLIDPLFQFENIVFNCRLGE